MFMPAGVAEIEHEVIPENNMEHKTHKLNHPKRSLLTIHTRVVIAIVASREMQRQPLTRKLEKASVNLFPNR